MPDTIKTRTLFLVIAFLCVFVALCAIYLLHTNDFFKYESLRDGNPFLFYSILFFFTGLLLFIFSLFIICERFISFIRILFFEETAFWIGLISAFIGLIISILLLLKDNETIPDGNIPSAMTYPFIALDNMTTAIIVATVTLSIFLLTMIIHNRDSLERFKKHISKDMKEFRRVFDLKDLRYFKDEDEAIGEVTHRIKNAKKVLNTHIRFSSERQLDIHLYPTNLLDFYSQIRAFCISGGSWIDVISPNSFDRVKNVFERSNNSKNAADHDGKQSGNDKSYKEETADLRNNTGNSDDSADVTTEKGANGNRNLNFNYNAGDDTDRLRSKYALYFLLKSLNVPFTNFIILTYRDNTKEVFFGWGINDRAWNTNVFASKNPKVVDYFFEHYMELIRSDAVVRIPKEKYDFLIKQNSCEIQDLLKEIKEENNNKS